MSVRIRLRRQGAKKQPSYRIVVSDSRAPRDGRFIEVIGHYNPRRDPAEVVINHEKAQEWLNKGATPSETVNTLFRKEGLPARPGRGGILMARRQEEAAIAARREQRLAARQAARPKAKLTAVPAPAAEETAPEAPEATATAPETPVVAPAEVPASEAPEEEGGTAEPTQPTNL